MQTPLLSSSRGVRTRLDTHLVLNVADIPTQALEELQEQFTKSNPAFWKKRRMGLWVGGTPSKVESWRREGMFFILPRGAKKKVEKILTKWDCVLQPVRDKMLRFPPANFKLTERSVLRPYQEDAVKALVQEGNGTIRGPCGSGKTVILIAAIAAINQPTLVIVHSRTLAQQWRAALNAWLGFQPGSIESGKRVIRPVTVATQQSVWKAIENNEAPWLQKFSVLVGDEIHHWAARTFQIVTSAFPGAWRIGASADERRKDGMEHLIYETFGDPVAKIKKDHLIQIGKLLPSRMEVVKTSYFDEVYVDSVREEDAAPDWVGMISRLVEDEERNEIIFREVVRVLQGEKLRDSVEGSCPKDKDQTNDLRSDLDLIKDPATENNCFAHLHCKQETLPSPHDSPRILLLNDRVESCKRWVHFLQGHGIAAGLMIGGPGNKDDLEETITGLRFGTLQVGVGTVVADEGLDIPPLTHVFITCPTHKHPKRMEQMLGRAARPSPGKDEAVCVYFWDCRMFPTRKKGESEAALALRHKKFLRELTRIVDSSKFIE